MSYALVTGPTSGIGLALANGLAARGRKLILVGRRLDALNEVAGYIGKQHGVEVKVMACDLAKAAQVAELLAQIEKDNIDIDVLVNNAGFATAGQFVDLPWDGEMQELQVNVVSLTQLCHGIGLRMAAARKGHILNVSSVTGFMAGPWMANYAAGKAFVLSLSESIREELAPRGVKVSVLCPGTTQTPFFDKASISVEDAAPPFLVMTPEQVATHTLKAMDRNVAVIVPRFHNKLSAFMPRIAPRWLLRKVVGALYRKVAPANTK